MPAATLRAVRPDFDGSVITRVSHGDDYVHIHSWPNNGCQTRSAISALIGGHYCTNWDCHDLPTVEAHALLVEQAKHQLGCDSLFPLMEMG